MFDPHDFSELLELRCQRGLFKLPDRWENWDTVWDVLNSIADEGATVVIKFDGGRADTRFTVVISGGRLSDDFFHFDSSSLGAAIARGVAFYADKCW